MIGPLLVMTLVLPPQPLHGTLILCRPNPYWRKELPASHNCRRFDHGQAFCSLSDLFCGPESTSSVGYSMPIAVSASPEERSRTRSCGKQSRRRDSSDRPLWPKTLHHRTIVVAPEQQTAVSELKAHEGCGLADSHRLSPVGCRSGGGGCFRGLFADWRHEAR